MAARSLRRVAVFCGSRPGAHPAYGDAADEFGRALVARDLGLVFGGSRNGLMGRVADAVMASGGEAIGVLPHGLSDRERAHTGLTELIRVDSMHARKFAMAEAADAFVLLPGGIGTLDEGFEMLTWTELGIHRKPVGILNVAGYYDTLLRFVDEQVAAGFVTRPARELFIVASEVSALLDRLADAELPAHRAWRAAPSP